MELRKRVGQYLGRLPPEVRPLVPALVFLVLITALVAIGGWVAGARIGRLEAFNDSTRAHVDVVLERARRQLRAIEDLAYVASRDSTLTENDVWMALRGRTTQLEVLREEYAAVADSLRRAGAQLEALSDSTRSLRTLLHRLGTEGDSGKTRALMATAVLLPLSLGLITRARQTRAKDIGWLILGTVGGYWLGF